MQCQACKNHIKSQSKNRLSHVIAETVWEAVPRKGSCDPRGWWWWCKWSRDLQNCSDVVNNLYLCLFTVWKEWKNFTHTGCKELRHGWDTSGVVSSISRANAIVTTGAAPSTLGLSGVEWGRAKMALSGFPSNVQENFWSGHQGRHDIQQLNYNIQY